MTNDECKMTKEIRMTEEGRTDFGEVHQGASSKRSGGRSFCLAALIGVSSLVIRHSAFC